MENIGFELELRPNPGPEQAPPAEVTDIWLVVAFLLITTGIAVLSIIVRYFRREKGSQAPTPDCFSELDRWAKSEDLRRASIERVFERLREHVKARFSLDPAQMTTSEHIDALGASAENDDAERRSVIELLSRIERHRFSGQSLQECDWRELVDQAQRLLEFSTEEPPKSKSPGRSG